MSQYILEIKDLSVKQNKKLVLSEVSLKVKEGEFVYLVGKTGSGKSSLLKVLYAALPIEDGLATVLDVNLKSIKEKDIPYLRRKLGVVFQDFQLLADRSIADNLKFVLKATGWQDKSEINKRILEVLAQVGMQNRINEYPHQLSGGEQQRVSIARALLNNPMLILADEPTGNLDPDTSEEILSLLKNIGKGDKTILMASHDYQLMHKFPSRTITCDNKKLIEN